MPNIAITTYCNLHCPYCFASNMIQTKKNEKISIHQFINILEWLNKDVKNNHKYLKKERIGIIGGEPTLHPQFKEILNILNYYCIANSSPSIIFSNGIKLEQFLPYIGKYTSLLLNINSPKYLSFIQQQELLSTLKAINNLQWFKLNLNNDSKATLGLNICEEINDYDFIWDIINEYKIKNLRVSVTAPNHFISKDDYYYNMKNKFLSFVNQAKQNQVLLKYDCNQIPYCYYSEKEQILVSKQSIEKYSHDFKDGIMCTPTIDITPDFYASACFGAYDLIDCNNFNNFNELYNYLLNAKIIPKYINNNNGICKNCNKHEFFQCQGGCLAFANNNK